jgi:hypothetical protein
MAWMPIVTPRILDSSALRAAIAASAVVEEGIVETKEVFWASWKE